MKKIKQIVAIVAIILLASLYLATFITAIVSPVGNMTPFAICLFGTVAIPLLAFAFIYVFGRMKGSKIVGDPDKSAIGADNASITEDSVSKEKEESTDKEV